MGIFDAIAHLFGFRDDEQPSEQDREGAEAIDDLTREGGEGEEYFEEGVDMGTIPKTPRHAEGPDTDKHKSTKRR
jgi:hypothetical protein